jgi:hypothetical protein
VLESTIVYAGLVVALAGLILCVKPVGRLRVPTRRRALALASCGAAAIAIGLTLPVGERRVSTVESRLDEFAPAWQFSEFHSRRVAAPPARVFDAIKQVRPDEILLFRTLIWIRAGFRPAPESIRAAAERGDSLIDIATRGGFARLVDDAPRELVLGTVLLHPPGKRPEPVPDLFQKPQPPGFALATMNFRVTPDGSGGSVVSTETRVFANSAPERRRFARYWRVIYPGSAIIRRMYLRAIGRRADVPLSAVK